ncbi:hypothetical protein [Ferruginibacter sp.]
MVAKLYTVVFIAATTFVSCMGNDNKVVIDESLVVPASANKAAADSAAPQAITLQPGASASSAATVPSTNNVTLAPQNIATAATAQPIAAGMNPAHGQPGHRCDIAVGAPLNSKPAAPTATTANMSTTQPQATPVAVNTTTAPGMNPPHGQPGHRCDISVGAPLNSKPAATAAPVVTATPVAADSAKK